MFSSTSPFSSLTCGGIHTEKKKRQKKSFFIYKPVLRGFARSRLFTDEDGTTNNLSTLTLHSMEWYIKKGGEHSTGYGLKEKERSM